MEDASNRSAPMRAGGGLRRQRRKADEEKAAVALSIAQTTSLGTDYSSSVMVQLSLLHELLFQSALTLLYGLLMFGRPADDDGDWAQPPLRWPLGCLLLFCWPSWLLVALPLFVCPAASSAHRLRLLCLPAYALRNCVLTVAELSWLVVSRWKWHRLATEGGWLLPLILPLHLLGAWYACRCFTAAKLLFRLSRGKQPAPPREEELPHGRESPAKTGATWSLGARWTMLIIILGNLAPAGAATNSTSSMFREHFELVQLAFCGFIVLAVLVFIGCSYFKEKERQADEIRAIYLAGLMEQQEEAEEQAEAAAAQAAAAQAVVDEATRRADRIRQYLALID